MASDTGTRTSVAMLPSRVRDAVDARTVAMLVVGFVAGWSALVLAADVVVLPLVGPVSGTLVGLVGLGGSGLAYTRLSCGGSADCGCSDDCGDSCSYDS